jgi:hypothetical protein
MRGAQERKETGQMNQVGIRQGFVDAGWQLDDGFYKHLIIGYTEDLSILAYRPAWEADTPEFQLCDHHNDLGCWVGEIPTPQQAAQLLKEHGVPLNEHL